MKIVKITAEKILFDNGKKIKYNHAQDCCENNYADFQQLDTIGRNTDFDENLDFEFIEDEGFRFGNQPYKMFFIPCYSEQNGWYTDHIDIYYGGKIVCGGNCEELLYQSEFRWWQ